MDPKPRQFATHLRNLDQLAGAQVNHIAIAAPIDAALVEGHDVLGEGARFIREYVLDLAQLLVERGGAGFGIGIGGRIVHLLIPIDEERLYKAYNLYGILVFVSQNGI